jgi:glycosyltransferase involved in cell wall biosynthesis
LLAEPVPVFGLVRTTLGYVLLGRDGVRGVHARVTGAVPWGPADALSAFARRKGDAVRRAESDLRRLALARCLPARLGAMLARHLPDGSAYLNVGHTNLTDRVLSAVRGIRGARIVAMVHDTIPLDFPDLQRPGTVPDFRARLGRVMARADLILTNSAATAADLRRHAPDPDALPPVLAVPLGLDLTVPDAALLPPGLSPAGAYFVCVGTIEPRKNHALLLDIWEGWGTDAPPLFICGSRGWLNGDVFRRLDALPPGSRVREVPGLPDGALAALVAGARGLLMPSIAEGFGLPPVEAAALGTPVLCADLPVYREVLGDIAVYANATDRYLWENNIRDLMEDRSAEQLRARLQSFAPPVWDDHFARVLQVC